MNNKPRPSLLLFAFGLSVIVATLRAAQTGFFHEEDFGWTVFAFCLSFGVTLVGGWGFFALPVEWHTMLTDVQYQATEKAKLIHQAETLGATPVAGNGAGAGLPPLEKAWGAWATKHLEGIRDGETQGPHYSGGMDAKMSYQLWKLWTGILLDLKLIEPVHDRNRTVFVAGVNAASAALAVRAAERIALPLGWSAMPLAVTEQDLQQ